MIPGMRKVRRESYNDPLAVYAKLKRLGMDLVTRAEVAVATRTPRRAWNARGRWCRARKRHYYKPTRDVFSIGREMVRENPATLAIAALGWLVPFILLENYVRESLFSRWWMARYLRSRSLRGASAQVAEVTV